MPNLDVVCPSGFAGKVRPFKVREVNEIVNATSVRKGTTTTTLLRSCWVETSDVGPYAAFGEKPDRLPDWDAVLASDRFVAILHVRAATYGPEYDFDVPCASVNCRAKIEWSVDILKDLAVKPIPESSLAAFRTGNKLTVDVDGQAFIFRLLTGADESRVNVRRADRLMTDALLARVVEIPGTHANDRARILEDLDMPTVQTILDALDRSDGGVETDLDVECPRCAGVQRVALPFGREFFIPKKRTRAVPETGSTPSSP